MSMTEDHRSEQSVSWIEVPLSVLKGEELHPYLPGEITNLFDWAENPAGASRHCMPLRGQFILDVVEIEPNAVHQPSKPGDELVVVLNGTLRLTNDSDQVAQEIHAGEMVLIPAGWAGVYRVSALDGAFLEVAIVPGDYFDPGVAPPPSGLTPRRIELPTSPGRHELFKNRFVLEAQNMAQSGAKTIAASTDEIIQVLDGRLTLATAHAAATFSRGQIVILPKGFVGRAEVTSDYRSLTARWIN
jgi:uncharacterized cupin superfamily protein